MRRVSSRRKPKSTSVHKRARTKAQKPAVAASMVRREPVERFYVVGVWGFGLVDWKRSAIFSRRCLRKAVRPSSSFNILRRLIAVRWWSCSQRIRRCRLARSRTA